MYIKTEGIVLRQSDYRDADRILTVLTRDHGKMTVKARGVKSNRSKLKSACQLLTYGEFTLMDYQGRYLITEADPKQMFLPLRQDLEGLALASYFAQVVEAVSQEDAPNPQLLSLILNSIYALSEAKQPKALIKAAFELRTACLAGYEPSLDRCEICGSQSPDRFHVSRGSVQCAACRKESEGICMPISVGVLEAMRYITSCPPKRLFAFTLPTEQLIQLSSVTEAYLCTQLEQSFYTLDFYKSLLLNERRT